MENDLLSWSEAVKIFIEEGSSEATFRRRVKKGIVNSVLEAGKKKGATYPRYQVLAAARGNKRRVSTIKDATFHRVTPDDMPEVAELIATHWGTPDIERWSSWLRANPDIGYFIRSEGRVVGCGFIVPFGQTKIEDILIHEVTPPTLPSEILPYSPDVPVCLYIRTVCIIKDDTISQVQKNRWGGILLQRLKGVVTGLGSRGIIIRKIYSRSDFPDGRRILHGMGFSEIKTTTSHHNYLIDVPISGLNIVLQYERNLREWEREHSGE